jgi:hypothetical protein
LEKSHKEDFIKIHSLKTPSSLSGANFLTGFVKSKVCTCIALRLAVGFAKNIRFAFVAFAA